MFIRYNVANVSGNDIGSLGTFRMKFLSITENEELNLYLMYLISFNSMYNLLNGGYALNAECCPQ